MLEQMRLIMQALPWTGPAVVVGALLGLLSMALFPRRRSHADRLGFALLVWCLVIALVVTLSPVKNNYFGVPTSGCDWSIWRPLARQYWFSSGSRPPNVWLFLPAGVGVMLLDGFWRKFLGIAGLLALPPGIEALQDIYPELKRSCSSQDVADNWTGLVIGLAIGLVLAIIVGLVRMMRRRFGHEDRRARVLDAERAVAADAGHEEVRHSYDEPYEPDDGGRLPLGGGAHSHTYDEFTDFDDRPNSSVWYQNDRVEPAAASDATPVEPYDPGHGQWHDDDATRPLRVYEDPDATEIIRRPRRG